MKYSYIAIFYVICAIYGLLLITESNAADATDATDAQSNVASFRIWGYSTLKKTLLATLRTLKGFNCLIKWVTGIQRTALDFNLAIRNCGGTLSKEVQAIVKANKRVITISNNILHIKTKVCGIVADEMVEGAHLSNTCVVRTLSQMWMLYNEVNRVVELTKRMPTTGVDTSECAALTTRNLVTYFTNSKHTIEQCSRL